MRGHIGFGAGRVVAFDQLPLDDRQVGKHGGGRLVAPHRIHHHRLVDHRADPVRKFRIALVDRDNVEETLLVHALRCGRGSPPAATRP